MVEQKLELRTLDCGAQLATEDLPERRAIAFEMRLPAGTAYEPADRLGLARLVQETVDKGTTTRTGRQLSDDFDAIGARRSAWTGRETIGFSCLCLPEFFDRALELFADFLIRPTFPEDVVRIQIELTQQELLLLEDDPQSLAERAIDRQTWGSVLGRHQLGDAESLQRIAIGDVVNYWRTRADARRMQFAVAGPINPAKAAEKIDRHFSGFRNGAAADGPGLKVEFRSVQTHHEKQLEQQQIAMGMRGLPVDHVDSPVETVLVKILSGGMSSRLFTEVREKRGLVYWVSAWQEFVRGAGMVFFGASSTPQNCEETYRTLLGEVARLRDDLTQDELDRAKKGILVRSEVGGDVTRVRCGELASDLHYRGRLLTRKEKLNRLMNVTIADIHRYLDEHPRNEISVVTLGPKPLGAIS